ncbi:iron-containing alcohol dehydrogenase [Bifidobacterium olomucense]|uniref:4-hydroxybutyrate dehydrogenase n=1 Tax=Bifidobacterium olomucense TaxID=2675324 RepID=A0A7Y0EX78_9BIFI|nr:iron-containing alcohol dehydrogenase [Bifidobacterium sp. DSM 109959]NMM98078.1 4-hydroxybutyrate dehydrogenase [Bifidobacterium sp. DSM 109959]
MEMLTVGPKDIYQFATVKEFAEAFELGPSDLVVSIGMIHDAFLKPYLNGANVLLVDKYGNQEPTDVMIDEIIQDAGQFDYNRIVAIGGGAAVHALSYQLGGKYHVPHGESNYAMFTGVLRNYMEIKSDGEIAKLNAVLADLLDCDVVNVYDELEALINQLLPKKALHEYGVTRGDLPEFTERVMTTQERLMRNNFVPLDAARVRKIFEELY